MSLRAHGVSYAVGGRYLISRLDFGIEVGEIVMLVGDNGAGKSTLLSLIAGCPLPGEGEVTLESRPLSAWSASELAMRRAVLPQSPALAFDFPVPEVVRLGSLPHAVRSDELERHCDEVMRWVDILQFADRGYFSLSGGERQRVHLARVLLQVRLSSSRQCYLLLDEPLAALDMAHQYALMECLRRLAAPSGNSESLGVGVVVVTHDLNIVLRYADRACFLKAGRCHASGRTAEVLTPENIRAVFNVAAEVTPKAVVTQPIASE